MSEPHLLGNFFHPRFEFFGLVGEGQFGALRVHGLGDAPGNGAGAGDTHDQGAFTGQEIPWLILS